MQTITDLRAAALTISALSRLSGVHVETIRYYERIGLLDEPPRTKGGHRSYGSEHVRRLRFIRRSRRLGFGTAEIRTLLTLTARDRASCAEARSLASARLADVRAMREDLARMEAVLANTIRQCDDCCTSDPMPLCPVLDIGRSH
jgi:MerR family transcriptional regulator, mercuric resistance operon regulatory protein